MKKVKISEEQQDIICEQLVKYGYFSNQLPACFTTVVLYDRYQELTKDFSTQKVNSECLSFTVPKNNGTRREIKIPNPEQQLNLINCIVGNIQEIKDIIDMSKNSLSNPFYIQGECNDEKILLDIVHVKDKRGFVNTTISNVVEKMRMSMGYKYCLKMDLATYYERIYTPVIEWLVLGKKEAKDQIRINTWCQELSEAISRTNYGEKSGIPTGPYTSRIVSELVVAKIDEVLEEKGFRFKRYVDDYEFYFRTKEEIELGQIEICRCLQEYKLHVNDNKIEVLEYPYYNKVNLNFIYTAYLDRLKDVGEEIGKKKEILIELFIKANELYSLGVHGAYKYLFKILVDIDLSNIWSYIEGFVVNTILINPGMTQYLEHIIEKNIEYISSDFKYQLVENLKSACKKKCDNEAQWLFWLLRIIHHDIPKDDILIILESCQDDLLMLMLIDYCDEALLLGFDRKIEKFIKHFITKLANNTTMKTNKWLIIYEVYYHGYFNGHILEELVKRDPFFLRLYENQINFYKVNENQIKNSENKLFIDPYNA